MGGGESLRPAEKGRGWGMQICISREVLVREKPVSRVSYFSWRQRSHHVVLPKAVKAKTCLD